ncbi:hypothetical protein, partial [Nostoc sp.]|uniref:hypothetical protein n=1 Tax=Nostoc sp. TaxID=1180 RepID=UPI002FF89161
LMALVTLSYLSIFSTDRIPLRGLSYFSDILSDVFFKMVGNWLLNASPSTTCDRKRFCNALSPGQLEDENTQTTKIFFIPL